MSALHRRARGGALAVSASLLLVLGPSLGSAHAQPTSARGPDPTTASISAERGPFATATTTLRGNGQFGAAQVYYPTTAPEGTYGVVAICPGFTASWSSMSWLGERLASQGFVVLGMDTLSGSDQPPSRGRQLAAVLTAAESVPQLAGIADFSRTAVTGWSMGGGGALNAARDGDHDAVVGIAPFEQASYSGVTEPTMIINGEGDRTAPPATNGERFYQQVNAPKALAEIDGGGHSFTRRPNVPQAASMIAFLKWAVDDDTRYTRFLTPGPPVASGFSKYQTQGIS